jgi:diaminopimelate decarboxylase
MKSDPVPARTPDHAPPVERPEAIPILPAAEIRDFVGYHFSRRDLYLRALQSAPPPLYLLDRARLREKARQFRQAFTKVLPAPAFYYAVKSNNHPRVASTLLESGFGLDVSSGVELAMALDLRARDIIFSGPGKTDQELTLAVAHSDRVVVLIDSFGELARLRRITGTLGREIRAGIRLNNNPQGLWRKFGILPEELAAFWAEARQTPAVKLQGIQFHSSWNLDPENQISFIAKLGATLRTLPPAVRAEIGFIDIGGGYWPPQGEWLLAPGTAAAGRRPPGARYRRAAAPIEVFAAELAAALAEHIFSLLNCRICFEPGRWLCNDVMHLLLSVVDRKMADLVVTDGGTNAIGWERFEVDYCPVLNLSRPALSETPCQIVGALCTPHDLWGDAYWGADIQPGDILLIPDQGAYTYSLRQNFIKALPGVVSL